MSKEVSPSENAELKSIETKLVSDSELQVLSSAAAVLFIRNVQDYAMFLIDFEGCILSWNPGVEAIFQYTEAEYLGQHSSVIFTEEDIAKGAPEQEMRTARSAGRAEDERWHKRKDGSLFWGSGIMTLLRNEQGEPVCLGKIVRDRTDVKEAEARQNQFLEEQKQARKEAEQAQREAEEANQRSDRFLSVISHEMRTPLNVVSGWTHLLRSDMLSEEASIEALDAIKRSTEALIHLVNDLLDVERMRSGKLSLELELMHLMPVVALVVDEMKPVVQKSAITLRTLIETSEDLILGDAKRLSQILRNLLSNAIKFTPANGHIEVCLQKADNEVLLKVIDTGKGIASEFLPHVFEPYRQAHESHAHAHGGLGLGLFVVQELVRLQNGTIEVFSAGEGQGTTFTIRFPHTGLI